MALSIEEVETIARLARLALTAEEKKSFQEQLSAILQHADRLAELDLDDVVPTTTAANRSTVWREDIIQPSLPTAAALFNAQNKQADQFEIQAVLDDSEAADQEENGR